MKAACLYLKIIMGFVLGLCCVMINLKPAYAQGPTSNYRGIGYAGEWRQPEGAVHLRARHYTPWEGRFAQRDTFAGFDISPQSLNRFYYTNNPVNEIDPSGRRVMLPPITTLRYIPPETQHVPSFDQLQMGLDIAGLLPFVGEPADASSGIISLVRGKYTDAAFSLCAIIPVLGSIGPFGKFLDEFRILPPARLDPPAKWDGKLYNGEPLNLPRGGKGNTSGIPLTGPISQIPGAPPVHAGKQGKHILGHPNYNEGKTRWLPSVDHVYETQKAWLSGQPHPKGKKFDTGRPISPEGYTKIDVRMDKDGLIHGYPSQ